eukprot:7588257-Heterocapsa_arctica.AAC.1
MGRRGGRVLSRRQQQEAVQEAHPAKRGMRRGLPQPCSWQARLAGREWAVALGRPGPQLAPGFARHRS